MASSWLLSLREGATLTPGDADELLLESGSRRIACRHLSPALRSALVQLRTPSGAQEDWLADHVLQDGPEQLGRLYYYLQYFDRAGLLQRSAHVTGERLATLVPTVTQFHYGARDVTPDCPYLLSRFAYTRRLGEELVLESPRARSRIVLHDGRAGAMVHALARPGRLVQVSTRVPGLTVAAATSILTLLINADMIQEVNADGTCPEEEDPVLQSWEFHDLLFHARSWAGRHDGPSGGTYRLAGRLDPPPALKASMSDDTIDLERPDLESLARTDPPLALVQEQRRSIRQYGAAPLSVRQLGEFLWRVGHVKECQQVDVSLPAGGTVAMEFAARPYPGGGALYELELYVAVHACAGLDRGFYHYDPLHHRLERLPATVSDVAGLLADATRATGLAQQELQVQIIIAARFQRMAWKYASMAYAAILKNVGVLYQTMYLVATAMGLAPCGIGNGDSDRFARAAGTDYYAETSVGEFLLGSAP